MLENTLPVTFTESLGSLPDAATGLVHLGNGRYYNPQIGRPLQPNPAGGVPTVPQSLNRYAATSLGQVGVAEGATDGGCLANFWCAKVADIAVDLGALTTGFVSGIEAQLTTYSVFAQPGSRESWTPPGFARHHKVKMRGKQMELAGQIVREDEILGVAHPDSKMAAWYTNRLKVHLGQNSLVLSPPGKWNRWMGDLHTARLTGKLFSVADLLEGGAAGFIFDSAWSYYQDMGNPYLTPGQKFRRAGVVGVTGFVAGGLVVLGVGTGGTGFGVSLLVGWTVEPLVAGTVFEAFPNTFQPQRRLKELQ